MANIRLITQFPVASVIRSMKKSFTLTAEYLIIIKHNMYSNTNLDVPLKNRDVISGIFCNKKPSSFSGNHNVRLKKYNNRRIGLISPNFLNNVVLDSSGIFTPVSFA